MATTPPCAHWATFHRPYFSDIDGTVTRVRQLFTALYKGGTDVLLVGHHHICERFRLQKSSGQAAANRIRQFIVGPAQEHDRPRLPRADRVGPRVGQNLHRDQQPGLSLTTQNR
jgi:hypothetical protein